MKDLSILYKETRLQVVMFFRERQAVFWTYIFPAGLLVLFTSLFSAGKMAIVSGMLVSVMAISVMSGGLFGIGITIVGSREAGIYKRYKTTPLRSWIIFASHILTRSLIIFSTALMLIIISVSFYGVRLKIHVFSSIFVFLLGILTFCALGFVIASFAKTINAALGITNALLMFMMFIGGFFPVAMLPRLLQHIAAFLPITYFRSALQSVMSDGIPLINCFKDISILMVFLLIFSAVSIKWFHWDRVS
ncbi:MAG: ABC transporter permease [Candidatus Omnitrophota bacterium]